MVNPKSDSQCHAITTQSSKVTTDPPIPTDNEKENEDKLVDEGSSSKQNKEEEKATEPVLKPIPRPFPPFP